VVGRIPALVASVPGVFVTAGVLVDVGEGVNVGVFVGMAIAVCVRPEENVATAIVCTDSTLKVGVASTSLDPQALTQRLLSRINPIRVGNRFVCFNLYSPSGSQPNVAWSFLTGNQLEKFMNRDFPLVVTTKGKVFIDRVAIYSTFPSLGNVPF
jgi:hypothetical protein